MMRKALFTLIYIAFVSPVFAQVIINESDIASTGSKIYRDWDLSPDSSIGIGISGDSITWDMSALMTDLHDSLFFADPLNTPYGGSFPFSNFCFIEPQLITFMTKTPAGIVQNGSAVGILGGNNLLPIRFDSGVDIIKFPAAYLDSFVSAGTGTSVIVNDFGLPMFDSIRVTLNLAHNSHFDGQGTLLAPSGIFPVLRQNLVESVGLTIDGGIDLGPFTQWFNIATDSSTTNMYYWWTSDSTAGYYVLSMSEDAGNISNVRWMPSPAVQGVNNPPFAIPDNAFGIEEQMLIIDVLANDYDIDGDPLSASITMQPVNGAVTVLGDNTVQYIPDINHFGDDVFSYQVCDTGANQLCNTTTVVVTLAGLNDAPVAVDDTGYSLNPGGAIVIPVQANDIEVDGDLLTTTIISPPAIGSVLVLDDDSVRYSADATFEGDVSFIYQVCDDSATCDVATVFVKIMFTSVGQVQNPKGVQVYPNPAKNNIRVKLPNSKPALFELFSLDGRLVLATELRSAENFISLEGIEPATYLYKVSGFGGGSITILK